VFLSSLRNLATWALIATTSSPKRSAAKNLQRLRPLAFILIAPFGVNSVSAGVLLIYPEFKSLTVTLHFGEYEGVN
jgi:hypothetical protein